MKDGYENGNATRLLNNKRTCRTAYIVKFEANHPGVIRKLYCYAESSIGNQSSFTYLAQTMNLKADTMSEISEPTKFNKKRFWRWFKKHGGIKKSPKEKPYLTQDQKDNRKLWCEEEKGRKALWGENFYACFLDEK